MDQSYMQWIIPPGFKFRPKDIECINYLAKKIANKPLPLPPNTIKDDKVYDFDPESLTGKYPHENDADEQKDWYFFTPRVRLSENASRPCRLTKEFGFWKSTSGIEHITRKSNKHEVIGWKRTLVYYKGKPANKIKTDWIMKEFLLSDNLLQQIITTSRGAASSSSSSSSAKNMQLDELVLCRIYLANQDKKKNSSTHKVTKKKMPISTNMFNGSSLAANAAYNYPEELAFPSHEYPLHGRYYHNNPLMMDNQQQLSITYQLDGTSSTQDQSEQAQDFNIHHVLNDHEYPPHQQQDVVGLHDPFPVADHLHQCPQQQQQKQSNMEVVNDQDDPSQQPEDWDCYDENLCFDFNEFLAEVSSVPNSPMLLTNGDDQPFNTTDYFPPEQQEQQQQSHFDHNNNHSTDHQTFTGGELANHQQEQQSPISSVLGSPPATASSYVNVDLPLTTEYISPQQPQPQPQEADSGMDFLNGVDGELLTWWG